MNDMTLSPMQQDYVTKKEFTEFKIDTAIRFDNVERSIKDLKSYVDDGFESMKNYIDVSFDEFGRTFGSKMDIKFEQNKKEIISEVREMIQSEVKSVVKAEIPGAIAEGIRMYVASTQK